MSSVTEVTDDIIVISSVPKYIWKEQVKMAELTEPLIAELSVAISVDVMEKIALGRLNISYAVLKNIKRDESNAQAVSREILRTWSYKNPDNQLKVYDLFV